MTFILYPPIYYMKERVDAHIHTEAQTCSHYIWRVANICHNMFQESTNSTESVADDVPAGEVAVTTPRATSQSPSTSRSSTPQGQSEFTSSVTPATEPTPATLSTSASSDIVTTPRSARTCPGNDLTFVCTSLTGKYVDTRLDCPPRTSSQIWIIIITYSFNTWLDSRKTLTVA